MAEQLTLTVPFGPVTPHWKVFGLTTERGLAGDVIDPSRSFIEVQLFGLNGQRLSHRWTGPTADADIVALNKVNLTSNSLERRILAKLIADGIFLGTVTGTVD